MQGLTGSPALWLVWALALYGLVLLLMQGWRWGQAVLRPAAPMPQSVLVLAHNQEHQIEPFLRALMDMLRQSDHLSLRCDVVVVDLASSDTTPLILERLSREEHIRLLRLPPHQVAAGYEMAHFLCHGRVATVIDLRGEVDAQAILNTLRTIW